LGGAAAEYIEIPAAFFRACLNIFNGFGSAWLTEAEVRQKYCRKYMRRDTFRQKTYLMQYV
jgi:hypothetical protein